MTTEEKLNLITCNCQEVLTVPDLKKLIESGKPIQHYIGFEISGMVHLGTGLMSMGKVADFLKAGVNCKIFLADFPTRLRYLSNFSAAAHRRLAEDPDSANRYTP